MTMIHDIGVLAPHDESAGIAVLAERIEQLTKTVNILSQNFNSMATRDYVDLQTTGLKKYCFGHYNDANKRIDRIEARLDGQVSDNTIINFFSRHTAKFIIILMIAAVGGYVDLIDQQQDQQQLRQDMSEISRTSNTHENVDNEILRLLKEQRK